MRTEESMLKPEHGRRNSVLLIVSLLAVFLVLYLIWRMSGTAAKEDSSLTAVIRISGEKVHTMDLDHDGTYTAKTPDGHYNVVVVEDHCVRVSEADCRNQVCVKTGQIRYPGEVIACMPHELILDIE